jgi:undecaprenyl phosphate-alpha-L-ara4N flippase subunit ArnE
MRYVLLLATITALAVGQILFKLAARELSGGPWTFLTAPVFLTALVVYAGATLSWIFVLRAFPITVAYPAAALAIVLVMIAGVAFFGETLQPAQWLGAAAIVSGLFLMTLA